MAVARIRRRFPLNAAAAAPVIDPTTWTSTERPRGNVRASATRHAVERVESAPLTTHVRDPRWADELGNRLASMVRTGESSASLQMTPVDLGPLEVNVTVRDNQATVHFGAANAETRALLEASIPRLREMLAAQGFQLMDSSVSQGFARQTRHEAAGTPRVDAIGEAPMVSAPDHAHHRVARPVRLISPAALAARQKTVTHVNGRHCVTPLTLRMWHARCTSQCRRNHFFA